MQLLVENFQESSSRVQLLASPFIVHQVTYEIDETPSVPSVLLRQS